MTKKYNAKEQLSEHFGLWEFLKGFNIADLTPEIYSNVKYILVPSLEWARKKIGVPLEITDGVRSRADQIRIYNNAGIYDINDIPMNSFHLDGLAADAKPKGVSVVEALRRVSEWNGGLELPMPGKEKELVHIHFDKGPKRRFFGTSK